MSNYQCNVCSHIYVTEQGDPLNGVDAATPFEELPDKWKCPVCGVGSDCFHLMDDSCEPVEMSVK